MRYITKLWLPQNLRLCCLLVIQLSAISGFTQIGPIDSLMNALPGLRDSARIDCLDRIGVYYLMNMHQDSSARYIDLIEKESRKLSYTHGMAACYMQKGGFANHFLRDYLISMVFTAFPLLFPQPGENQ